MKSKTPKEIPTLTKEIPASAKEIPTLIKEIPTSAKEIPTSIKEIPAFLEANATKGPHRTILRYQIKFKVMKS